MAWLVIDWSLPKVGTDVFHLCFAAGGSFSESFGGDGFDLETPLCDPQVCKSNWDYMHDSKIQKGTSKRFIFVLICWLLTELLPTSYHLYILILQVTAAKSMRSQSPECGFMGWAPRMSHNFCRFEKDLWKGSSKNTSELDKMNWIIRSYIRHSFFCFLKLQHGRCVYFYKLK